MSKLRVLIVEDEEGVRIATQRWLSKQYQVKSTDHAVAALEELTAADYDIVLSDVRMPGMDGFALLKEIRKNDLADMVILMSAFGDEDAALNAIKLGAYDYIPKPFTKSELMLTMKKAEERERLSQENASLRDALQSDYVFQEIVSKNERMHQVFKTIRKVASFKSTVLITGESGTGKELIARALHFQSKRAEHSFVAVNCGAIPEQLLESELFGHVKGAFTDATRSKPGLFEEAHQGTLFLDEINALPQSLQVKLLRVLQEEEIRRVGDTKAIEIDTRIVAAGIEDLGDLVEQNEFREDLYYRLNVLPIHLPPLRERREDIPLLIQHFLGRLNEKLGTQIKAIEAKAMDALIDYHWPGNIRELINILERTVVLSEHNRIDIHDLPPKIATPSMPTEGASSAFYSADDLSIKKATRRLEKHLITLALQRTAGNRTQAAKILEISHRALLYKIKDYELQHVQ